jgi:hypothetical protein
MKRLLCWVMLGILQASAVYAAPDEFDLRGLGKDRENLTPELIASRSERLEATMDFYLLRFPSAASAPSRIFGPEIWKSIQAAADAHDIHPLVLAGMIFIESYGNPLAKSPTGPAGIAQMTKSSAKEMGLVVGKKIQIGTKEQTRTRKVGKGKNRRTITETKFVPVYKVVDQRYDPDLAIMAMARRLNNRRAWLGGNLDFAIAEYHMGAGRMSKLLSAYFNRKIKYGEMSQLMRSSGISYPELFWTNTPYFRAEVYKQIEQLNRVDFSPTYYFRVQQAIKLLEMYRKSPAQFAGLASSYQGRRSQFDDGDITALELKRMQDVSSEIGQRIVALPAVASSRGIHSAATVDFPLAAERSTVGCLLFIADQLQRLQGSKFKGFETFSMIKPADSDVTPKTEAMLPMHTMGWAFDLRRKPLTKEAVRDLNFVLSDLRFAGLLTYAEEGKPKDFHVVRHPEYASSFEKYYWSAVAVPQTVADAAGR